ncbi:MAG: hypothetical protein JWO15_2242 [Sphingomonadales bacterium]|nr:hypothetical protein [Sphingomonadales bacterium]
MLSELDDTLWHQLALTFDHVGTSDPRFFDRYWFAAYAPDGSGALQATMGVYRNMNVIDGGVSFITGGKQHNLRVSRSIARLNATVCGPLRISVLQPLQRFQIDLHDEEGRLSGEILWDGSAPPEEEAPHFKREHGRVVEDYQRFNQIGRATGWVQAGDSRIEIRDWWACRDHSWGVRPRIGIREPRTGPAATLDQKGFTMAFLFFSTDWLAGTILIMTREGEPSYVSGTVREQENGTVHELRNVVLEPRLHPATRRFQSATLIATLEDGHRLVIDCTASGPAVAMQGIGYSGGYNDKGGLGAWRGTMVVEHDVWDVVDPAQIRYPEGRQDQHWHRIQPVVLKASLDGRESIGQGSMTLVLSGSIPSLGLL